MCDPVLIAAILEEVGYLDEKKEKDKKREISNEEGNNDSLQDSWEKNQKRE